MDSVRRLMLAIVFVLGCAWSAHATCSETSPGTHKAYSCTAGSTWSFDLQLAYNAAVDGAVITLDTGTYTGGTGLTVNETKGVTVQCATVRGCTVNVSNATSVFAALANGVPIPSGTVIVNATQLYRLSGFIFDGGGTANTSGFGVVWLYENSGQDTQSPPQPLPIYTQWQQVRIDHNTFQNFASSAVIIQCGGIDTPPRYTDCFGVVDHNIFTNPIQYTALHYFGPANPNPILTTSGTSQNLFIEDNQLTYGSDILGAGGCLDAHTAHYVVRFNTSLNCHWVIHGVEHSAGSENFEFYGNIATMTNSTGYNPDGTRLVHTQGSGEFLNFGNRLGQEPGQPHSTDALGTQHYRDDASYGNPTPPGFCDGTWTVFGSIFAGLPADGNRSPNSTYFGYPCLHQPGRDFAGVLRPDYSWDNAWVDDGSYIPFVYEYTGSAGSAAHFITNRDLYNAGTLTHTTCADNPGNLNCAPFNGATGMGVGPIAQRPSHCTPTDSSGVNAPDAGHGGVGYASTDEGTWKTATPSQGNTTMPAYKLYICTALNTWTAMYGGQSTGQPYIYPHPLAGGSQPAVAPGPPTNFTISQVH